MKEKPRNNLSLLSMRKRALNAGEKPFKSTFKSYVTRAVKEVANSPFNQSYYKNLLNQTKTSDELGSFTF